MCRGDQIAIFELRPAVVSLSFLYRYERETYESKLGVKFIGVLSANDLVEIICRGEATGYINIFLENGDVLVALLCELKGCC